MSLTVHHVDAERFTLTIKTLKRLWLVFRTLPVPQAFVAMLRKFALDGAGRFRPMHRVTAWHLVKATMLRAGINGPMACTGGIAPRLGHPRGRLQQHAHSRHLALALDEPRLPGHDGRLR